MAGWAEKTKRQTKPRTVAAYELLQNLSGNWSSKEIAAFQLVETKKALF